MPRIEDAVATAGTFAIGADLRVRRLRHGAMRPTGPGGTGEPADPAVPPALTHLERNAATGPVRPDADVMALLDGVEVTV